MTHQDMLTGSHELGSQTPQPITLDRIIAAVEAQTFGTENPGFCKACGADAYDCEPDARNYTCEECGEDQVFGAEEMLI